jgi:hypothetical protein
MAPQKNWQAMNRYAGFTWVGILNSSVKIISTKKQLRNSDCLYRLSDDFFLSFVDETAFPRYFKAGKDEIMAYPKLDQ